MSEFRFQTGDKVVAIKDFDDITFFGGDFVRITIREGHRGEMVQPGPDSFGLYRVRFESDVVDAWDGDISEIETAAGEEL